MNKSMVTKLKIMTFINCWNFYWDWGRDSPGSMLAKIKYLNKVFGKRKVIGKRDSDFFYSASENSTKTNVYKLK